MHRQRVGPLETPFTYPEFPCRPHPRSNGAIGNRKLGRIVKCSRLEANPPGVTNCVPSLSPISNINVLRANKAHSDFMNDFRNTARDVCEQLMTPGWPFISLQAPRLWPRPPTLLVPHRRIPQRRQPDIHLLGLERRRPAIRLPPPHQPTGTLLRLLCSMALLLCITALLPCSMALILRMGAFCRPPSQHHIHHPPNLAADGCERGNRMQEVCLYWCIAALFQVSGATNPSDHLSAGNAAAQLNSSPPRMCVVQLAPAAACCGASELARGRDVSKSVQ